MATSSSLRTRPTWPELPAGVQAAIEERLGGQVLGWTSHDGGYTPGLASTLRTGRGVVFVKAVPVQHEFAAHAYREEARRSRVLPVGVPAPRLRWQLEVDDQQTWVAVAFDAVRGRTPASPLAGDELTAVVRLTAEIAEHEIEPGALPPAVEAFPTRSTADLADRRPDGLGDFDPWFVTSLDRLAAIEQGVTAAVTGDRLVHGDLRGDDILLVPAGTGEADRAVAVDWPFAARGAAFCDLVLMLPAVHAEGGPRPDEVLSRGLPRGVADDDAINAFITAITGYFVDASMQPPPPATPGVRELQRAQAEVCVAWLRRRLD